MWLLCILFSLIYSVSLVPVDLLLILVFLPIVAQYFYTIESSIFFFFEIPLLSLFFLPSLICFSMFYFLFSSLRSLQLNSSFRFLFAAFPFFVFDNYLSLFLLQHSFFPLIFFLSLHTGTLLPFLFPFKHFSIMCHLSFRFNLSFYVHSLCLLLSHHPFQPYVFPLSSILYVVMCSLPSLLCR